MNCEKANSLLSAYLDRELAQEERRQLRLHLLACDECTNELRELETVKEVLGGLSITAMPPIVPWLRLQLAGASPIEEPSTFIWQSSWFRRTCAVAALLLLFGLGSWLLLPQQTNTTQESTPHQSLYTIPKGSWVDLHKIIP